MPQGRWRCDCCPVRGFALSGCCLAPALAFAASGRCFSVAVVLLSVGPRTVAPDPAFLVVSLGRAPVALPRRARFWAPLRPKHPASRFGAACGPVALPAMPVAVSGCSPWPQLCSFGSVLRFRVLWRSAARSRRPCCVGVCAPRSLASSVAVAFSCSSGCFCLPSGLAPRGDPCGGR